MTMLDLLRLRLGTSVACTRPIVTTTAGSRYSSGFSRRTEYQEKQSQRVVSRTDARMRVLLISADFPPVTGGVATFSVELVRMLQLGGHGVSVLTSVGATHGAETGALDTGIRVLRTPRALDRKLVKLIPLFM